MNATAKELGARPHFKEDVVEWITQSRREENEE